jgi:alpha-beta hydrolase superfamily lysophospholipase
METTSAAVVLQPRPRPRRSSRGRWLAAGAMALTGVAALVGCQSIETRQRQWIFQPSKDTWWAGAAAAQGMAPVWIDFQSKESGKPARLHGLWLANEAPDAPVLLYLHGARWNVTGSAGRMRRMQELGFSVLGIDYRGFGQSSDSGDDPGPSEARAYEDARAAWDWLAGHHPDRRRYVFGHSLGSAIAVQLASEVSDASGLIVEAGFPSIAAVVSTFKWGWLPVGPLISQRFDAESRIARVKAPVLVVHGSDDRLIPAALGRTLYEKATAPKRFVLVEGGSHHSTNAIGQAEYGAALHELFGPRL